MPYVRTYVRECAYVRTLRLCCARRSKYARAHACTNVRTFATSHSLCHCQQFQALTYVRTRMCVRTLSLFCARRSKYVRTCARMYVRTFARVYVRRYERTFLARKCECYVRTYVVLVRTLVRCACTSLVMMRAYVRACVRATRNLHTYVRTYAVLVRTYVRTYLAYVRTYVVLFRVPCVTYVRT